MLGGYGLCAVNREIQREVNLGNVGSISCSANRLHQISAQLADSSYTEISGFTKESGTGVSSVSAECPPSPATSAKSTAETIACDPLGNGEYVQQIKNS